MIDEIKQQDAKCDRIKVNLDAHIEEYKSAFLTTVFNQDKNDANFRTMQGKTENLKAYLDGKID
jgi:hypothetical protein